MPDATILAPKPKSQSPFPRVAAGQITALVHVGVTQLTHYRGYDSLGWLIPRRVRGNLPTSWCWEAAGPGGAGWLQGEAPSRLRDSGHRLEALETLPAAAHPMDVLRTVCLFCWGAARC